MTQHPIAPGAKARVTDTVTVDGRTYRAGFEFEVEAYVPAEESDDARAYYEGSSAGGSGDVVLYADNVEQVMSAEQMAARQLPTLDQVRRHLMSGVMGDNNQGLEIDETIVVGEPTVALYGQTAEGLRFTAHVTVTLVEHADF